MIFVVFNKYTRLSKTSAPSTVNHSSLSKWFGDRSMACVCVCVKDFPHKPNLYLTIVRCRRPVTERYRTAAAAIAACFLIMAADHLCDPAEVVADRVIGHGPCICIGSQAEGEQTTKCKCANSTLTEVPDYLPTSLHEL